VNRAQRRRLKKKNKGNEKLAQKISTFSHRPDACSACEAAFDPKSKEHALTWRVVVYENPTRVSLFCPTCINKTKEIIDEQKQTND
jgi:hypothetical protein